MSLCMHACFLERGRDVLLGVITWQLSHYWESMAGISMEGDDELLAQTEVKVEPKRDEWMTTLPPERKVSTVNNLFFAFRKAT